MSLIRLKHKMRRAIRPFMWAFLGIFLVSIFYNYGPSNTRSKSSPEDVIARVNGQDVTQMDYDRAFDRMRQFLGRQGGLEMQMMLARYAFDQIVEEFLRKQAAEQMGVDVSRREAGEAARANVDIQLKQLGEGLSGSELQDARMRLESLPENQEDTMFRQILTQRLDEKLRSQAHPVEVHAAEILVRSDKRSKSQTLDLARKLHDRAARSPADFATIARSQSEDSASRSKGGDLGWLRADSPQPSQVLSAAFRTEKGQVSDPVATPEGYAIVKALDTRPYVSIKKDPKEAKEDVDGYQARVGSKIADGFYAGLKSEAKIEPLSAFARGLQAERDTGTSLGMSEASPAGKARLQEAVRNYEAGRLTEGARIGAAYDYHLGQLYDKLGQYDRAAEAYRAVLNRQGAAEVQMALGGVLEKLNDKPKAVEAYEQASKTAWDQPSIHGTLAEKFRKLGRPDLAAQEDARHKKYLAEQKAEQDRQKKAMEEQRKLEADRKKAEAATKKADEARRAAEAKKTPGMPLVPILPEGPTRGAGRASGQPGATGGRPVPAGTGGSKPK